MKRGRRTALIPCLDMRTVQSVPVSHTIQVWGIASFILFGFATTFN